MPIAASTGSGAHTTAASGAFSQKSTTRTPSIVNTAANPCSVPSSRARSTFATSSITREAISPLLFLL